MTRFGFPARLRAVVRARPFALAAAFAFVVALVVLGVAIRQATWRAALLRADPDTILMSPALRDGALSAGQRVYRARCATCHGAEGAGRVADGVPNLRDQDWLYGEGRVSEIENIIRYGIRSRNSKGWNLAAMPAYASTRPYALEPIPPLAPQEVDDVVQLLLGYEGRPADGAAAGRGLKVYQKGGCWDCHGPDGHGDAAIGAPNLRDAITLYGGSRAALTRSVERGRRGISPAFADVLDPAQIRAAAVYVAALSDSEASHAPKALP